MEGALQSVFDRFWQWRLKEAPEFGTMIGEHGYDDDLGDMSLNSYAKRLENAKEFVAELENIDMNLLSKEDNMNCKLLHLELSTYVSGMGFKCHLFPVNCLEGPHIDFKKTISWMKTENLKDIEKILSRFNKFPVKVATGTYQEAVRN